MYGIISDTHCHNWTTFSKVNEDGVNNRLQIILNEIERAGRMVAERGGKYLFHAGDLFHVRGSISPSVLNPTLECFKRIIDMGVTPVIICGNHDAEFKETNDLGSAVSAMAGIGCKVVNRPEYFDEVNVLCVPWVADKQKFLETIKERVEGLVNPIDVICHVALDGVFSRIDSSQCVDPHEILDLNAGMIARVFAGHLHCHKEIEPNVWSIGAVAQHNWGDAGTKAGFLLVDDEVQFVASHAPQFIDVGKDTTLEELQLEADGNYIRAVVEMKESEIKQFRKALEKFGAKGVTIICHVPTAERTGRIAVAETDSLESVVQRFIKEKVSAELASEVEKEAMEIMAAVGEKR